jgi:hypothetical protein
MLYHLSNTCRIFCSGYFADQVTQTICLGYCLGFTQVDLDQHAEKTVGNFPSSGFLKNNLFTNF